MGNCESLAEPGAHLLVLTLLCPSFRASLNMASPGKAHAYPASSWHMLWLLFCTTHPKDVGPTTTLSISPMIVAVAPFSHWVTGPTAMFSPCSSTCRLAVALAFCTSVTSCCYTVFLALQTLSFTSCSFISRSLLKGYYVRKPSPTQPPH